MSLDNRSYLPPLNKSPEPKSQNNVDDALLNIYDFKIIEDLKTNSASVIKVVENTSTKQKYISKTIPVKINSKNKNIISNKFTKLLRIQNPSINAYQGFSFTDFDDEDNLTIFMNWFQDGSLVDIHSLNFDNTKKQKILIGIAHGMMILHKMNIIHGDLKLQNILITPDFQPIITDYGLSKFYHVQNFFIKITSSISSAAYIAPEVLIDKNLSQKSDIYAFGILMFEILQEVQAYSHLSDSDGLTPSSLIEKVQSGLRPTFEKPIKDSFKTLILECLSHDPNDRPTFSELFEKLSKTENDKNGFLLDGVDVDEILSYLESITAQKKPNKKNPRHRINQNRRKSNHKNENDTELNPKMVRGLQKANSKLLKENSILKQENSNLLKENDQILTNMVNLEKSLFKIATVEIFNSFSLHSQILFVSELISNSPKPNYFFTKLNKILLFIEQFDQKGSGFSYVEIVAEKSDIIINTKSLCKKWQICIRSNATTLLHSHNSFRSTVFINFLKEVKGATVEIPYPSEMFDSGYDFLLALREKSNGKIKIGVFINGVERTGPNFQEKTGLDSIRIGETVSSIEGDAFSELGAFKGCTNLSRVEISTSVNSIDRRCFKDCSSLMCIFIPSSVNFVGSFAFSGCTNLCEVSIPSSVYSIENGTFEGCSSLKQIKIPSSVSLIGQNAFKDCIGITDIELPNSVSSIGEGAFCNCIGISKIKLSDEIECISNFAFWGCSSLSELKLPKSVSEIGFKSFMGCSGLKEVIFSDSLKSIGNSAFQDCDSLEKVKIPSSVDFVGDKAFPSTTKIINDD